MELRTATARPPGTATVSLGADNDKLTLDDSASISTLLVNDGLGTDTFGGTKTRPGLTIVSLDT